MTKTPKRSSDLANGETSEGKPSQPTSGEGVANALERWEEEGGAPTLPWPFSYETGDLLDAERRVLECLERSAFGFTRILRFSHRRRILRAGIERGWLRLRRRQRRMFGLRPFAAKS